MWDVSTIADVMADRVVSTPGDTECFTQGNTSLRARVQDRQSVVPDIKLWESEWFVPLHFDVCSIYCMIVWLWSKRWTYSVETFALFGWNVLLNNIHLPAMVRVTVSEFAGLGWPVAWQLSLVLLFLAVVTLILTLIATPWSTVRSWWKVNPLASYRCSLSWGISVPLIFHKTKDPWAWHLNIAGVVCPSGRVTFCDGAE